MARMAGARRGRLPPHQLKGRRALPVGPGLFSGDVAGVHGHARVARTCWSDMVTSGRGADLPTCVGAGDGTGGSASLMWQRDVPGVSILDSSNIGLGFCLFFFELLSRDVGDGCTPRRAVRLVCTCPHRDFSVVLGGVWLQPVATRLACCRSTSWMALLGGHWTCVSCAEHILVNGGPQNISWRLRSRHLRPPLGGAST